ncbi:MAG: hypothetical protein CMJ18_19995 [Phycisphaeraceae bacterium]|nr:hypothetical protein [Phycisphaeraceae bacterium]
MTQTLEQNAMKTFIDKFSHLIVATLGCFDRVVFKGHLPFCYQQKLEQFVDYVLRIRRTEFMAFAEKMSQKLVDHAEKMGDTCPGGYEYVQGKGRKKDGLVLPLITQHRITEGLVCVRCFQECCQTFKLIKGKGRPQLKSQKRPQRVLYYYYLHRDLGLLHVRLQTWFPFTIQITVNGHEWLARQMQKKEMGFNLRDNAFTQLDDPKRAQKLADQFAKLNWVRVLNRLAHEVNPLLKEKWLKGWHQYYWVTEQAEYATDLLFTNRQALSQLFPRLMDHATLNFSAQDILGYLGRRLHWKFDGEVVTDCKKDRWPGARVRHQMKKNWLKMYDKFGLMLRVETVINDPHEFKVRRRRIRNGERRMVWCPMNKGVANLYRYEQVSRTANERYLQALAVVDDPAPAYRQLHPLAARKINKGRSYAGFNPARREDVDVFAAVLNGNNLLRGFRNVDVRRRLFGEPKGSTQAARDAQRKRQSGKVTRLLKRLHVRRLIAKVPRSHRWHVTDAGQQLLGAAVRLYHRLLPGELAVAT